MSKSRSSGRGNTDHLELIPYRPERSWPVQLLLAFWRWAIELTVLVVLVLLVVKVHHLTGWKPLLSFTAVLAVLGWVLLVLYLIEATRAMVPGLFWCLVTRHRLRTFFLQGRVFNRSGRLPWIVFVRPTPVGERVTVWLVPGLSVDDFAGSVEKLTAATWARTARVERSRRVGSLLRVDIVRRDPLTASASVGSVLIPASRKADEDTDPVVAGPLDLPRTPVDLSTPLQGEGKANAWGSPAAKKTVNPSLTGKARLSTQDSKATPSTPAVVTRGGEDVSDYV